MIGTPGRPADRRIDSSWTACSRSSDMVSRSLCAAAAAAWRTYAATRLAARVQRRDCRVTLLQRLRRASRAIGVARGDPSAQVRRLDLRAGTPCFAAASSRSHSAADVEHVGPRLRGGDGRAARLLRKHQCKDERRHSGRSYRKRAGPKDRPHKLAATNYRTGTPPLPPTSYHLPPPATS